MMTWEIFGEGVPICFGILLVCRPMYIDEDIIPLGATTTLGFFVTECLIVTTVSLYVLK